MSLCFSDVEDDEELSDFFRHGPSPALSRFELCCYPAPADDFDSLPDSLPTVNHLTLKNVGVSRLPAGLQTLSADALRPDTAFQPLASTLTLLEFLHWEEPGELYCLSGMSSLEVLGINLRPYTSTGPNVTIPAPLVGSDLS